MIDRHGEHTLGQWTNNFGDNMNDLQFLEDSLSWSQWPFVPLVRKREYGLVIDDADNRFTVFRLNLFGLYGERFSEQMSKCEKHVYGSFEELLADGWRVD